MLEFVSGLAVGIVIGAIVMAMLAYLRGVRTRADMHGRSEQFQELTGLIGRLAHEIKNPLSTIKVNLKLAGEELSVAGRTEDKEQAARRAVRKITVIQKEADRLEQILEDYLRYLDKTEPQFATVDVNEVVGDMVDFYAPQAYSHGVKIRQMLFGSPLVCRVDVDMLKQAMLNLFINAQQAMAGGGELMIQTDKRDNRAAIRINDTGCGIEPDRQSHVFDVYHSSRARGSGLGLPMVKKVVESHGGSIDLSSEPGKGTSFTIELPLTSD